MAYTKQNFKDGKVLKAEQLNKIEEGIGVLYDDLYDTKKNSVYDLTDYTVSLTTPLDKTWSTSTFSGWYHYCGTPSSFDRVVFPITVRDGYPITEILVKIFKMPALESLTINNYGVTPTPINWECLASTTVVFEEILSESGSYNITADFNTTVDNSNGDHLFVGILCSNIITMGYKAKTYSNIPYNPWYYYATSGSFTQCTAVSGVGTYDSTSSIIYVLPIEFYEKTSENTYVEIGTSKKDKFFNLVNDCINNSDSFGEIFEEAYKSKYAIGSQDLLSNTTTKFPTTTSTFTGVMFPIGVIPEDYSSDGCCLKIRARSCDGVSNPITKVWAYLYSVEQIPYALDSGRYEFSTLNPSLLRSGVGECNINPDEEGIVSISWSQGEFINTEGKFLMLGYNCDSYNYRCFTSETKTGAEVCASIDGNTYSNNLDTWYSTSKTSTTSWYPHWVDTSANAWSLITLEKYYDLGEKFYDLLKDALANTSVDADIAPTSEVRLAKQYDLVVGDTFQLYYDGVVKAFDVGKEGITIRCSKGKEYPRYWEYTPASGEEGTYSLTLYTRQLDGSIISQGTTTIVVHSKLTNSTTPENINILCFGDSLTAGGQWIGEGLRRIYGNTTTSYSPSSNGVTHTVTTYGNNKATIQGFTIYHEGYGGWTWDSFLGTTRDTTSSTSGIIVTLGSAHGYDLNTVQKSIWTDNNGLLWELEDFPANNKIKFNRGSGNAGAQANTTLPTSLNCSTLGLTITPTTVVWESGNPFYNEDTESIDFADHASQFGVDSADIVACLLTWNGGGGELNFNYESKITAHINKATELLRIVHTDFPEAKIIVMGVQISSITGGTGYNYGANGSYADRMGTAFYAFDYDKALEELVTNSEFGEYCYYVDTKGQFDTTYNMPYTKVNVNTRNSNIQEMRGTNGVHPSTEGYYQIGDAFYRALTKVIPMFVAQ